MTLAADAVNPGRFLSLLPALLLVACGDSRLPQLELAGEAMGTTFKVVLVEPPVTAAVERLEAEIVAALQAVDQLASTWRSDSELSVFNSNPSTDWISVSATFCSVLERALDVSRSTDGAFDVTVGPLVNLWGFGPDGIVTQPPSDNAIAAARENVGFEKLATGLMKKTFSNKGVATVEELRELCVEAEVEMVACQMTVDVFGFDQSEFIDEVTDYVGATSFLPVAQKADVCLFM